MSRAPRSRPAYAVLARFYDEAYALWRCLLSPARDEVLRANGVGFSSVLDLGCASGWQSLELARRGHRVVAVDPVPAFVRQLSRKGASERLDIEARVGSCLAIPRRRGERFDLVLSTFDVLNHLERHEELAAALKEIAAALRPGGHLLFDVNTPEIIASLGEHHRVYRLGNGGLSAETGSFDPATGVGTIERDWFLPRRGAARRGPCSFTHVREEYREIAWSEKEIRAALRQARLRVRLFADAAGWLSAAPPGTRFLVLARRPYSP